MMSDNIIKNIINCRICESSNLKKVISLGDQYITSRFPIYGDFSTPKTPIDLCVCNNCRLLQLYQTTQPSELYEYEYGYRSGISNTMREHLKKYQEEILSIVSLKDGDVIVDIGSNDSTMLQYYSKNLKRIGIDPTGNQFKEYYNDVELLPTYFNYDNFTNVYGNIKCKMISSISMFYDLPQPVQFAKDIYSVLDDDGIWTCEQSYLLSMLKTNSIDTICHEHLEYYALYQIKEIADKSNFKIIDIKFNDCNGGSFRIYFAKKHSKLYNENTELINKILQEEIDYGIFNDDIFSKFINNCDLEIKKLKEFVDIVNKNNKKIYIYGASTKGNCLLQYANLNESDIKYAVERNPKKVGKMTCTGIEIIMEENMRVNPPKYLLVLPWHFRDEIIIREKEFLNGGGQLVFPFPKFEIVGSKPKVLITGCDGMISQYVIKRFSDCNLYGIGKTEPSTINTHKCESNYVPAITLLERPESNRLGLNYASLLPENSTSVLLKCYFDMNNFNKLEDILSIIKPDVIIHLASISSSEYALNNPIETLKSNGLITSYLCDIIHRNKWHTKLFNASSSEIYKGHIDYSVKEDDHHMFHLHPYSIAKIMSHSIIDFYRTTYNLPFSNGVIFTIESHLKKPVFLLNKVAEHIRQWNNGNIQPLIVGNLSSYRNILHASDLANAIYTIILQDKGENYIISNDISHKVEELVVLLYSKSSIQLTKRDNVFYENEIPVVIIQDKRISSDTMPTNITGETTKLKNLGWYPCVSIDNILNEISL